MVFKVQKPLDELLTNDMVNIYVEPKRKHWCLHKDLLCDRSSFFRAAFSGGFKEAKESEMHLPEDDQDAFKLFVNWLYGAILVTFRWFLQGNPANKNVFKLCKLYVLSSKLCIEPLMNLAMDEIRRYHRQKHNYISYEARRYISATMIGSSPLLDYIALGIVHELTDYPDNYCKFEGLLRVNHDLALIFIRETVSSWKARDLMDPDREGVCLFHEHKDTEKCKG